MRIPSIHVLTDHNAINSNVPHFSGAMSTGFQLVVNLFSLIGAFNGCATAIDHRPFLRVTRSFGKQPRVVLCVGVVDPSVFCIGARGCTGIYRYRLTVHISIYGDVVGCRGHSISSLSWLSKWELHSVKSGYPPQS